MDGETKNGAKGSRKLPHKEIERLKRELKATRDYLQTTVEEQEATNEELHLALEEIRSSNEELQSTNEEMETAKEELQSTNEELITVNEELRNSNSELNTVNNDLMNLLNNISFAVVMVDNDLRIRRFTPAAGQVLNLLPADIGRPITDLRLNIKVENLGSIVEKVVTTLSPEEMEIQTQTGKAFVLRISPYKTMENQIEGVILSLLGVDEARKALQQAAATRKMLESFQDSVQAPVVMTDDDFVVIHVNPAFAELFNTPNEGIVGKSIFSTMGGHWTTGELGKNVEGLSFSGGDFKNIEADVEVPNMGVRRFQFQGRRIEPDGESGPIFVLTVVAGGLI